MKYLCFLFALCLSRQPGHLSFRILPVTHELSFAVHDSVASLSITQVTEHCFVFVTYHLLDGKPYPANGMYLITTAGAVLFDTPWDTAQCRPLLDSIWSRHHQRVVLCISTHFHADRTGGIPVLRALGVKTYASALTDSLCRVNHEPRPAYTFNKDTLFTIGGRLISTYYPGRGHTLDNIVIWLDREKILYGGCLIKSVEADDMGYVADGDVTQWPGAIKKLQARYPQRRYVIPGHLGWRNTGSLEHTLALIHQYQQAKGK